MDRRRRRRGLSKRDGNHGEIVAALLAAGRSVVELDAIGVGGTPDILVGWGKSHAVLMEIKDPTNRGRLDPKQIAWHAQWKGPPVVVVESIAEALLVTGIVWPKPSNVPPA